MSDALGFVAKEDILHAVKAIVATQRDYGRRDDRKMARLKYLVDEWGLPKFRSVVEQYFGKKLQPFRRAGRACHALPCSAQAVDRFCLLSFLVAFLRAIWQLKRTCSCSGVLVY